MVYSLSNAKARRRFQRLAAKHGCLSKATEKLCGLDVHSVTEVFLGPHGDAWILTDLRYIANRFRIAFAEEATQEFHSTYERQGLTPFVLTPVKKWQWDHGLLGEEATKHRPKFGPCAADASVSPHWPSIAAARHIKGCGRLVAVHPNRVDSW